MAWFPLVPTFRSVSLCLRVCKAIWWKEVPFTPSPGTHHSNSPALEKTSWHPQGLSLTCFCSFWATHRNPWACQVRDGNPSPSMYSRVTLGKFLNVFQSIFLNKEDNKTYWRVVGGFEIMCISICSTRIVNAQEWELFLFGSHFPHCPVITFTCHSLSLLSFCREHFSNPAIPWNQI